MKGDGAIDNPWIPDTVQEFRMACSQQGYVRLEKDLDCNRDGYYEWGTLNMKAEEVDFNGFALKNPYITSGNVLLEGYYGNNGKIKNGKILNIYENGAKAIFYKQMCLEKMAISANCNSIKGSSLSYCIFDFCNIFLIRHSALFQGALTDAGTEIKNSRLEINASFLGTAPNTISAGGNIFYGTDITSSLITGNATITTDGNWLIFDSYGNYNYTVSNSICDIRLSGESLYFPSFDDVVVNKSNAVVNYNKNNTKIKLVTDEQLRNPDYLNSIGFNVVKV